MRMTASACGAYDYVCYKASLEKKVAVPGTAGNSHSSMSLAT